MFKDMSNKLGKAHEITGGKDGLYYDPNDKSIVIIVRDGITTILPIEILNHPALKIKK